MTAADYKWIKDPFVKYGRQWQMFRLLVKTIRRDGSLSEWQQATTSRGTPTVYIPVKPNLKEVR
jgi:hypothetical protein